MVQSGRLRNTVARKILESIDFVTLNLFSRKPSLENPFAKLIMPPNSIVEEFVHAWHPGQKQSIPPVTETSEFCPYVLHNRPSFHRAIRQLRGTKQVFTVLRAHVGFGENQHER